MSESDKFLILFSLLTYSLGTYFIWFSRWNVLAHLNLGFAITAHVLPICFLNVFDQTAVNVVLLYRDILLVGAVFYLIGLFCGAGLPSLRVFGFSRTFDGNEIECFALVYKKIMVLMMVGVVGLFLSFLAMGFVPMFAQDPLAAKFFKGPYHDAYIRVAVLYRSSYMLLVSLVPVACILWYRAKNILIGALCFFAVVGIALSLTRAPAVFGVLTALGIYCASKGGKAFIAYLLLIVFIFPFGSAVFYLLGIFDNDLGIIELIAQGVPDISDHLLFLDAFVQHHQWTFGKTFWGGMVPGNFEWNPAVYALEITNGGEVSEISSGGFRLPVSIWGYSAFGWIGVVIVPLLSGIILGNCIGFCKQFAFKGNEVRFSIALLWLSVFGFFWSGFYVMSMYSIPKMLIAFFVVYNVRVVFEKRIAGAVF